ncbi:hypothetical protein BSY19_794 [Bosea sp. RAC05]|nr:hypothetical protein BSY19_794 [Bosea sp. RAC05]
MILSGQKTWEMRKSANHDRGLVGLIRKGSGHVVGVAELVASLPAIDPEDYAATEHLHGIRGERQTWAITEGYTVPWVLAGARPLTRPVAYRHKSGAQSRVILDEDVGRAVRDQQPSETKSQTVPVTTVDAPLVPLRPRTEMPRVPLSRTRETPDSRIDGDWACVSLTQGNLNSGHFYLRSILEFFPAAAVGGSDKGQIASLLLDLAIEGVGTVRTDITGPDRLGRPGKSNHRLFRDRTSIAKFFKATGAEAGDLVMIERRGPQSFHVTLKKAASPL